MKNTFTYYFKVLIHNVHRTNDRNEVSSAIFSDNGFISYHLTKFLVINSFFLMTCFQMVYASTMADRVQQSQQEILTIKGTVVDDQDTTPLPGASFITIIQKKVLGVTNLNGEFSFKVAKGEEIRLTYLGYVTQIMSFNTSQNEFTIRLKPSTNELKEVVVTALGIKRDEKALGYSVSTVTNEELTDALSNNWSNALTGKVAGLNLIKSGGGPDGSNKIILRGENTLSGNNAALIVIDGVITSSSSGRSTGGGSSSYLAGGTENDAPADFGSSLADINPEDIQSVSILKGPGASALYGSRGANGAIIITTKTGKSNTKGIGVTFNSNTAIDVISRWPDYQTEYGQGSTGQDLYYSYLATADGPSTRSTSSAWGPKFDGQSYYQYDPATRTTSATRLPWVAYPNNHKDFFQTGQTYTNSLTFEGGNSNTSARLSLTNVQNKWIMPNTGYGRNAVALSVNSKLNEKLQISSKINYTNKFSDNLPSTGYQNQSIMYFIRGLTPNMNMDWFKEYWVPGQEGILQTRPFSSLLDNPYLIANEMLNKSNRNNVNGNVSATYNFTKNLSLMLRTSLDLSFEERSQQRPKSTQKFVDGMYRTQEIYNQEINSDFLIRYNNTITKKFDYSFSLGGSHLRNKYIKNELRADKLLYPDVYTLANSKNTLVAYPNRSQYMFNSFYGLGSFAYDNFIYMDITARNDWSSTLASPTSTKNVSFFYPSVSLSLVLSSKIKLPEMFSFVKLRGSLAGTGSGTTDAYRTSYNYVSQLFSSSLANPTYIANPNLKPLNTTALELGADIRMFQSRLGFDIAVYRNNTSNQIFQVPIDKSTGYSTALLNSGLVRNDGIEIAVNGIPVKNKNFEWSVYGTFAANKNQVVELADSINTLVMSSGPRGTIEARPGGSFGAIYGLGYERAPDGQIVYNNQGLPILGQNAIYLGNSTAKWKSSLGTSFKYKQFNLSLLFDGQFGGVGYSLTTAVLSEEGKLQKTVPGRYNGIIGKGVIKNADGSYSPNTIVADAQAYYTAHFIRDNVESNIFSTDFIKFREIRLDYNLSKNLLKRLNLQRASLGVYGRDLYMFTNWPAFDPEFGTIGSNGDISAGFETAQLPSTTTYGINFTIGF